ncbi:MAG: hypothetical protein JXA79_12305 [Deltaproteobacteria bacterium]|nr:hypothetical protein [Deltaproteobacteria bacterium]
MTTEEFHRKLTAILSADVQGYSRLMGEDEDSTIRTLTAYRALMSALIQKHRGHVVDSPGDNLLAEFGSVMDAVRCAVEIQEELRIRNADLPKNRKMQFRIGINMGDIIEDGDHIYGDGINIAARVEGLAEGGGICISGTVYDAIRNKLSMSYEFMGEHVVKNIKELIRIYRIRVEPEGATQKKPVISDTEEGPKTIAVIPFVNLSSDPEQEYFVDGLSDELLNSLTQIPDLLVTARTSSFAFKGTNKKVQEIANELGVVHILEGSVRKAGNALRITAQLVRASDGFHLWSKTYKRNLEDVFIVQEDIAEAVSDELSKKLGISHALRVLGGTEKMAAYERYLIAHGQFSDNEWNLALESINEAIAIDPRFSLAWALKAAFHNFLTIIVPTKSASSEQDEALNAALRSIELEPNLAAGHYSLGITKTIKGHWIEAELAYQKAIELTNEQSLANEAIFPHYLSVGQFEKANKILEYAKRKDPLNQWICAHHIISMGFLGDIQGAKDEHKRGTALFGNRWLGDYCITQVLLGAGESLTNNDVLPYLLVDDIAKKYFNAPESGLAELHLLYADNDNLSVGNCIILSLWAAHFGDHEFALEVLQKALKIEASGTFYIWLPHMRKVRQLPRFKELVREIGLVDYWNKFGWPDLCHKLDNGDFVCD